MNDDESEGQHNSAVKMAISKAICENFPKDIKLAPETQELVR
jgi:hypothetical protein